MKISGFTTTDGVITSEFDSASPATIRVKALLEPKPVLIHDKLDINNLSAPNSWFKYYYTRVKYCWYY
jgi:hypothetical protein